MTKSQSTSLLLAVGLSLLAGLQLFVWPASFVGFLILVALFYFLDYQLRSLIVIYSGFDSFFVRTVCVLAYGSISLSLIYYILGLNRLTIFFWLVLTLFASLFLFQRKKGGIRLFFYSIKKGIIQLFSSRQIRLDFSAWPYFLVLIFFILVFFSRPILDGNPSPWPVPVFWFFFVFAFLSLALLYRASLRTQERLLPFVYLFLIFLPIAASYVLSYGYDTLIHQGALQHISEQGRIEPLTPFYIGQYVWEILLAQFSGFSFSLIERFLTPLFALFLFFGGGAYFFRRLAIRETFLLIPLSVLFLLPDIFGYTSPFATSLLWGLGAALFVFLHLAQKKTADLYLACLSALASVFVHPFVGLNVLLWTTALYWLARQRKKKGKTYRQLFLALVFVAASLAVAIAFIAYNWLSGRGITLFNPLDLIFDFANIFTDPAWYHREDYPWWLGLIYLYERLLIFIVFLLLLFWRPRKYAEAKDFLLLLAASLFLSAWLFISGFKIDNYYEGDQVNYAYRLIQTAKWFLWPLFLLWFLALWQKIKTVSSIRRWAIFAGLAVLSSVTWYLSYPRQDAISQMSINSLRQVDLAAVDFIYEHEGGKTAYLVLANQIIGAGAISRYGFGPYFDYEKEELFYYSLPWGGRLSLLYNDIMNAEAEGLAKPIRSIGAIASQLGLDHFYFVYTDAWSPSPAAITELEMISSWRENLEGKIFIYRIDLH